MKTALLSLLIVLFSYLPALSQVLKVTADVQYAHLQSDEKEDLSDFGNKLEQYFNSYSWIDDEFEYDVECKLTVIFRTVQRKTHEKTFFAQMVFSSSSGETFLDDGWEFPYDRGRALSHMKGMFDPITHVLDYYAHMILAAEMDINGTFLGEHLYNNARDIIEQAIRSEYPRGWANRKQEFEIITDVRTKPLRRIKPDFFEALALFEEGQYKEAGPYAEEVFKGIGEVVKVWPTNRYLQMFFNAHYNRLAMLYKNQNNKLEKLAEYDSKHREAYRRQMR